MSDRITLKQNKREQKVLAIEREKYHKNMLRRAKEERFKEKILTNNAYISLSNINKIYPNHVQAVYDFSLDINEKEFIVFVGPSGCGKSTTLRMIAGLEDITYGDLFIDGKYANELSCKDRNVGVVFQSYALYPHMSVYDNLAFGLQINHVNKLEIDQRVRQTAEILELTDYLYRKPSQLSGGQCQRVALGRAIIKKCKVFLMDEPLSNLDAKLRVQMRSEIVKLHNSLGATTIYVTHDQTEAMTMASRIVVMSKGYIQQIGTPSEIYNHPQNIFVATFIGSPAMNLIESEAVDGKFVFANQSFPLLDNFINVSKDFYEHELELVKKEIEQWKDEFLSRFHLDKKNKKLFEGSYNIIELIKKTISSFDNSLFLNNPYYQELNNELANQNRSCINIVFDKFLKEYLFSKQQIDNPLIIDLMNKQTLLYQRLKGEQNTFIIGIRPEDIIFDLDNKKRKAIGKFDFLVTLLELVGNEYIVHVDLDGKRELLLKIPANEKVVNGEKITVSFDLEKIHVFDPVTKKAII